MADGEASAHAPAKECDLIMKGGITSGVVYPPAILALQSEFRFRSVGGSSAGAIAAAGAAAAEFGRESGGFAKLQAMQAQLKREGFLIGLFQPSAESKPLFDTLLRTQKFVDDMKERATKRDPKTPRWREGLTTAVRALELLRGFEAFEPARDTGARIALGIASAIALFLVAIAWPLTVDAPRKITLLVLYALVAALGVYLASLVGGIVGALAAARRCFASVTDGATGYYGFCRGTDPEALARPADSNAVPALTDWLTERLNDLAGLPLRGEPLTVAQLRTKTRRDAQGVSHDAGVTFRMITTNLSHRQPYTLPMPTNEYIFAREDMERLFPPQVVKYLVAWGESHRHRDVKLPDGFHRFPSGADIPVVVATRMSLSFPILLCAVRLYSIKPSAWARVREVANAKEHEGPVALQRDELDENWFSDGGIASNFPIHMFDAWLPTRPTFGISLRDVAQRKPGSNASDMAILPSPRFTTDIRPEVERIDGVAGFLGAVFGTAQNYRDNAQVSLPSYRERVAQVLLAKTEGGLNLAMPPDVIQGIEAKGVEAARLLRDEFDFDQHRWVRVLVLMARLEAEFDRIGASYADAGGLEAARAQYRALLDAQVAARDAGKSWYKPKNRAWCAEAADRVDDLLKLIASWEARQKQWALRHTTAKGFFTEDPPYPEAILRVTPEH